MLDVGKLTGFASTHTREVGFFFVHFHGINADEAISTMCGMMEQLKLAVKYSRAAQIGTSECECQRIAACHPPYSDKVPFLTA